jgi:ABC-type transporter MlaC component
MKAFFALSFILTGLGFSAPSWASANAAVDFVNDMGIEAVSLGGLKDPTKKLVGFCRLVKTATTSDYIVKDILGKYYDSASVNQVTELKRYIDDLLVAQLTKAFEAAAGGELKALPRVIESQGNTVVRAELYDHGGRLKYKFQFHVVTLKSSLKIIDARIQNIVVSRYLSKEYTSFMDKSGGSNPVAALLDHLAGENPSCP